MLNPLRLANLFVPVRRFGFKSDISLDKLYPGSKLKLSTPTAAPVRSFEIFALAYDYQYLVCSQLSSNDKFNGYVPLDRIQVTYSCSSGPGGQNVNKVQTKCDLRFRIEEANWLSPATKTKLAQSHPNRVNKEGYLVIKSDITRYRLMNLADALEKLRKFIRDAELEEKQPDPDTVEKHKRRLVNGLFIPNFQF